MTETGLATVEDSTGIEVISSAVLEAIARTEGVAVTDLETPMVEWVDPDLLNSLFRESPGVRRIAFDAYGHEVTVAADGSVTVDGTTYRIENLGIA